MTAEWRTKWTRLTHMSWDEIGTRLGQAARKRSDLLAYRVGIRHRTRVPPPESAARANFFFTPSDLHNRIGLHKRYLSQEVENIISEADAICRHEFNLLGYEKLQYGDEIDWHLDAVHGKRAPRKPWFKINFLDFAEVGDHKVIWELNRHQHFMTLAKAYRLTGHDRYVQELSAQWYSWQKANPYPLGINWASSLEVAFRSLSWLWVRALITGSDALPASFETDLLQGLQQNGHYIERYLSTYFSPNTHLLGEAVALFFIGTLCPQLHCSSKWQKTGWDILLREAGRQVRPDGVYFEQALYYHVYALDLFLHSRILAALNKVPVPGELDDTIQKMLKVVRTLSQAGPIEGFGDDDGGRVFNPRRNRVEHMTDPLALGAVLYGSEEYRTTAGLTEEAVWLFGERAVATFEDTTSSISSRSQVFESAGIYVMGESEPCPQRMMIDGGPQGTGHAGHGHADALSVRFSIANRRVLIDAGTGVYLSADKTRNLFRGTAAHNTLQVDNSDQAVPLNPFAWASIPRVHVEKWMTGASFDLFIGSHDGYQRLTDPVLHRRFIFHAGGGFWFIRDVAEGKRQHLLQTFWHFAHDLTVTEKAKNIFLITDYDSHKRIESPWKGLVLLPFACEGSNVEISSGTVSPSYGATQAAPVVAIKARIFLPAELAVILVSLTPGSEHALSTRVEESNRNGVRGYTYETGESRRFLFFGKGTTWHCGPWSSDAEVLYAEVDNGRLVHLVTISGSFANWRHKHLMSQPNRVERFEWLAGREGQKIFSSDPALVHNAAELDFEFLDPVR